METMAKLKDKNIGVYRTDESGTVIAISDGNKINDYRLKVGNSITVASGEAEGDIK